MGGVTGSEAWRQFGRRASRAGVNESTTTNAAPGSFVRAAAAPADAGSLMPITTRPSPDVVRRCCPIAVGFRSRRPMGRPPLARPARERCARRRARAQPSPPDRAPRGRFPPSLRPARHHPPGAWWDAPTGRLGRLHTEHAIRLPRDHGFPVGPLIVGRRGCGEIGNALALQERDEIVDGSREGVVLRPCPQDRGVREATQPRLEGSPVRGAEVASTRPRYESAAGVGRDPHGPV